MYLREFAYSLINITTVGSNDDWPNAELGWKGNLSMPVCDWAGVTCNGDGLLTGLSIAPLSDSSFTAVLGYPSTYLEGGIHGHAAKIAVAACSRQQEQLPPSLLEFPSP